MARKRHKQAVQGPFDPRFLVAWREHRGLTQKRLADRVGVTDGVISKIENGKQPLKLPMLMKLAVALDCAEEDILHRAPGQPETELAELLRQVPVDKRDDAARRAAAVVRSYIEEAA